MNKGRGRRNIFEWLFIPHYDEISLFSMGYVCLLLFVVNNPPSQWDIRKIALDPEYSGSLLIFAPFLLGMGLCLYHAFVDREKTNIEKKLMIFFAAILNGFSGIWGGTYFLIHHSYWGLSIFPFWNIISGYILLTLLRVSDIEEKTISDVNASLPEIMFSALIVTVIFLFSYFLLNLNWASVFSICIAWSTNFYGSLNSLVFRERIKAIGL